jgi:hypothetical protein
MSDIKRISGKEFRDVGFLQEANRQFFHPHGLALEVTTFIEPEEPQTIVKMDDEQVAALREMCDALRKHVGEMRAITRVEDALEAATRYELGDAYISGCWDDRDDPEGIVFGSWDEAIDGRGDPKADRVLAEREKHFEARCELFGVPPELRNQLVNPDIEPIGWIYPEGDSDSLES